MSNATYTFDSHLIFSFEARRQSGRVVRVSDLHSYPEVPGSSPVLVASWSCFSAAPKKSPAVRLLPAWILKNVLLYLKYVSGRFVSSSLKSPFRGKDNYDIIVKG